MAAPIKSTDNKTKKAAAYTRAAKKAVLDDEDDEDDEDDTFVFDTEGDDEGYDPAQDSEFRDIFVEIGDARMQKGLITKYFVKKNGELLKTVFHPYSFERLKDEHGGGVYIVEARDDRGKYLKQQTMVISGEGAASGNTGEVASVKSELESLKALLEEKKGGELGLMEILAMQREAEDRARREAREAQKELQGNQNQLLQTVLTLMAGNSNKSETMVLELAKMTQSLVDKLNDSQSKMFEKINERFERVVESIRDEKKEKAPSAYELLKLQKEAEDQGFKRFQMLNELAEAKAEEKIEMIEAVKENEGGERESVTDTLIKTMLPSITNALASSGQPVAGVPTQAKQIQAARRSLPGGGLGAGGRSAQASGQARGPAGNAGSQGQGQARGQSRGGSDPLGLSKVSFGAAQVVQNTTQTQEGSTEVKVEGKKKEILDAALPVIIHHLTVDQNFDLAAENTLKKVAETTGYDGQTVLTNFTREDVLTIVKGYNLPSAATPWFNKYYDSLSARGAQAIGTSTTG